MYTDFVVHLFTEIVMTIIEAWYISDYGVGSYSVFTSIQVNMLENISLRVRKSPASSERPKFQSNSDN